MTPRANIDIIRVVDRYGFGLLNAILSPILRHTRKQILSTIGDPARILVIKFWGMGNIIRAAPAMKAIRARYPRAHILLLTLSGNGNLYRDAQFYDECIELELNSLFSFAHMAFNVLRRLRSEHYDLLVNFEPLSRFVDWYAMMIGSRLSAGFVPQETHGNVYNLPVRFEANRHISENFACLAERVGTDPVREAVCPLPLTEQERQLAVKLLPDKKEQTLVWRMAINVNASNVAIQRRWPSERFVHVVDEVAKRHPVDVIFIGSEEERGFVESVIAQLHCRAVNLAGKTSLRELAAVLERCDLLVTNDTGPMHLADAMGVPIVALFGPESPAIYGPRGELHELLYAHLPCSPCISFFTGKKARCRQGRCMAAIPESDVVAAVERVLGRVSKSLSVN